MVEHDYSIMEQYSSKFQQDYGEELSSKFNSLLFYMEDNKLIYVGDNRSKGVRQDA